MRDLTPLLRPRSIAVVGASSNLQSPSGKPVRFIRESGADVAVYPVNPSREEIAGYRCYPDPESLPEAPDVAIVVVPTAAVVPALEALGRRGARAAVIITSGFGEGDAAEGRAAQERMREIADEYDMILVGPNTLGIHDYVRGLPLSFVWYGTAPVRTEGTVAVVTQSGSGMTSLCDRLIGAGLPIGYGIATGNEADLSIVDAIEYLAEDPSVEVIATVFEEIRDGARFQRVLRRLRELGKPLVAMKVGRTESGSAMVKSHTGALAGSYPVLHALLRQHGVLEVQDLDQLPATIAAALLGTVPRTEGIAMVTNSGGAAAIAADRADELGVRFPVLSEATQQVVRDNLPAFAQGRPVHNPIDITAQNVRRPYAMVDIAAALVDDPEVGGVIVGLASGGGPDGLVWTDRFIELANAAPIPVLAVILSEIESAGLQSKLRAGGVPVFSSPGAAVETLQRLRRLATTAVDDSGGGAAPVEVPPLPESASEYSTMRWLEQLGVPVATQRLAANAAEAVAAAEEIGYPVVVKIDSPDIPHKTEVGGVAVGLADADTVAATAAEMLSRITAARPDAEINGVTVSEMVSPVLELIAGVHADPTFGPVVMLGLGGIWAEVLGDVSMRGLPLPAGAASQMIDELRAAPLLKGARGLQPVDVDAVSALVEALAAVATSHCDVVRGIDLNPVAVTADGRLVALDAMLFTDRAGSTAT